MATETRTASEIAAELIRESEGFSPAPYLCPAGVPTIGHGFTRYPAGRRVTMSDAPISQEVADVYLAQAVLRELEIVQALVPGVDGPRLAALIDFAYNMGATAFKESTLRRFVLAGDWPGACDQLRRWVHSGKPPRVLQGLVMRREREIALIQGAP